MPRRPARSRVSIWSSPTSRRHKVSSRAEGLPLPGPTTSRTESRPLAPIHSAATITRSCPLATPMATAGWCRSTEARPLAGLESGCPRGPLDKGRSYGGAQWIAFLIGKAEPARDQSAVCCPFEHGGRNRIEPQLCSPEQGEGPTFVDGAPAQIDEPAT